tara:strand:- start:6 stop:476 length:471 start_codon:yes stop_codon:yes gene_type:complete
MKKIIIVLLIFFLDRFTKMYFLNLQEEGINVDFYVLPFLNFFLVWNAGVGFGMLSLEANIMYHIVTIIIAIINLILIYLLIKTKTFQFYMIAFVTGGALGNLFDRIYYNAVPDFIDLHIEKFHWFTFNVADIFITIGIVGLIFVEIFKKDKIKKNA